MPWIRAGQAGVDTGSILVTDPCYVVSDHPNEPYQSYEQLMDAVDLDAPYVQLHNEFGAEIGVYVTRFGGDGVYPVYVETRGARVVAVQIRFDGNRP